jgi:SAM-dependent methyltransferase
MARIPAPLSNDAYQVANEAFLQTWSSDEDELQVFLEKHAPPSLESVVSVGAGNGERDVKALATLARVCLPCARVQYIAVEPNQAQMDLLQSNMKAIDNIDVTACVEKGEDYKFGIGLHDLVLFTHSLYHMPGFERDILQKAMASLKPHGRIVIALSTEQGGIFKSMGSFWGEIDYSHFETGSGLFGQESMLKLVKELELEHTFLPMPNVFIDASSVDTPLLNFIMQCDTEKLPHEMVLRIRANLVQLAPEGRLPHGSGLACILQSA